MKSETNKTDYDDELFYEVITASMKTILSSPLNKPFKIEEISADNGKQDIKLIPEKAAKVKASAAGIIEKVEKTVDGAALIVICHRNSIKTFYAPVHNCDLIAGNKIKQGDILGIATRLFFSIDFPVKTILED